MGCLMLFALLDEALGRFARNWDEPLKVYAAEILD